MATFTTDTAPQTAPGGEMAVPETRVRWSVPVALFSCVLLAFFDKISIAALFTDPHFQQAMGIDFDTTRLGLLMSAFLLSYGFSSVFLSSLGDKISPVKLLSAMMVSWCVLMVLMGLSHNYSVMIALRILLGIAEGPLLSLAYTIVRRTFPARLQARATMMWLLGTPIGAAIGFPLSIWLLNSFGWQSTFFVMALLTLPVLILVRIGLRHIPHLATGPGATSQQARRSARHMLMRNPHFWLICLFNIAFLTYLWGINGWLPGYLIKGKGIHLEHAGLLSSLPFIAMLLGEVTGAWLSDKSGRRAVACFISMAGAALGLFAVLHLSSPLAVIAAMSFSTFMWGAGAPNIFALLSRATPPEASATAGGIFNGLGNFAGALSPAVMGLLIAYSHSMDAGLLFLVMAAALSCVLLLPLLKRY
ncbi:MFS transporter [Shimwellia blattae]|uniref:Transporter n=1 Tax=Shimwellia blattae (strain ATCC 29907 / DSM 4481 / JCM 1650 / NBRC 105725 / CDC 9005-74) TaxID=630626 RepID=I2B5B0_SHIBC|nr:MFS transporter [Shimwellia blattae]AFJ45714.1 transporter [Shimwellia blattae DSM 4481 = NBRC 105725]GAB82162.1 putative major facilitator superfamily transporter [Shimwellia blattae DSM 4481 = NBRC 105725]VDY63196.1 D-galactonate transporter [Shimwellia blattae]VEC20858.1 D-galactonate transporter [Shimwellia blattae]